MQIMRTPSREIAHHDRVPHRHVSINNESRNRNPPTQGILHENPKPITQSARTFLLKCTHFHQSTAQYHFPSSKEISMNISISSYALVLLVIVKAAARKEQQSQQRSQQQNQKEHKRVPQDALSNDTHSLTHAICLKQGEINA
mmetsp:Transcript_12613/g.27381  ORF Transcript_12613/g.27381 Transcript_12613/m.27381 type:complete len:143 (-) Transcript_12613:3807-4235(-)